MTLQDPGVNRNHEGRQSQEFEVGVLTLLLHGGTVANQLVLEALKIPVDLKTED